MENTDQKPKFLGNVVFARLHSPTLPLHYHNKLKEQKYESLFK